MELNKNDKIRDMCKKIVELAGTDQDELDRRLGMLVCDELLDDIRFKPLPAKPDALVQYEILSKDQKFRWNRDNPDWRQKPTFQQYLVDLSSAESENNSNVYWLKYWRGKVDKDRAEKFRLKLVEFSVRMPGAEQEFKPNVEFKIPEPVQTVMDMFGGKLVKGERNETDNFNGR
jgi:hypothetical protein